MAEHAQPLDAYLAQLNLDPDARHDRPARLDHRAHAGHRRRGGHPHPGRAVAGDCMRRIAGSEWATTPGGHAIDLGAPGGVQPGRSSTFIGRARAEPVRGREHEAEVGDNEKTTGRIARARVPARRPVPARLPAPRGGIQRRRARGDELGACSRRAPASSDTGGTSRAGARPRGIEPGGTLQAALTGEPDTLDPATSTIYTGAQVYDNIFSKLIDIDENNEFYGVLATDWNADDDTTWVFDLAEGVTFHNGEPFTRRRRRSTRSSASWTPRRRAGTRRSTTPSRASRSTSARPR